MQIDKEGIEVELVKMVLEKIKIKWKSTILKNHFYMPLHLGMD